jgi:isopenicillin N synthase-like dioxygenase
MRFSNLLLTFTAAATALKLNQNINSANATPVDTNECSGFKPQMVDLTSDESSIVAQIKNAAENHGVFYVCNHGIGLDLANEVSKAFFDDLNQTERNQFLGRGYVGIAKETLNKHTQTVGDQKHGFSFKSTLPSNATKPILNPPLVWSNTSKINVADNMHKVVFDLTSLGTKLAEYFCLALGIDRKCLSGYLDVPLRYLRLLEYPAVKSIPEQGIFAAGAHTDYGLITILDIQQGSSGLEILVNGAWVGIPKLASCLIINVGEMMLRFSNGRFKPVPHRVVMSEGTEARRSMPFFLNGNNSMTVYPLVPAMPGQNDFANTTFAEFLAAKIKESFPDGTPNQKLRA